MIVIAICNTKGGVGKTTLTTALAVRAAKDSPRVGLVDLDPQKSLAHWWGRRGKTENPGVLVGCDAAADAVERASQVGYDWLFLDSPPAFLDTIREMLLAADFAVIPVKSGIADMLATQDAVALARETQCAFVCVFNDVAPPRKDSTDVLAHKARGFLFSADVPVADAQISHRKSHVNAMNTGKSAAECKDEAASAEIDKLWTELKAKAMASAKLKAKSEEVAS